jgi:predicted esterase
MKPSIQYDVDVLFARHISNALFMILPVLLLATSASAQQVAKTSPAGTKMWVYTPPAYSSSTATFPLLVFLHGGGEIGDDLTKLTTNTSHQFPPKLISLNQWDTSLPFIVVSPQLKRDTRIPNPNDQEWPAAYMDEVVEYVRKNYRVDSYRIYFTGASSGGAGVWTYAAAYPTKVAALLPISGKSDKTKACLIKNIPVWCFHGENDLLVPNKFSIDMVAAIKACNGTYKPRLNLLHSRGHEGWNELYNRSGGYDIYKWLLRFKRGSTYNPPYVNAGIDNKILLRSTSHHIAGDYFDWNGSISSVKWTQTSGTALSLSGSTSAFLKLSSLKVGTYEFQLAVTDNSGTVSTDRVKLVIVSPTAPPAVNTLVLVNGKTDKDIKTMTEGMVIDKTVLGTVEFNVKALVSSGTNSVRFRINADQHTRTVNYPGPYLIKKPATTTEWIPTNGTCVICATPYPSSGGKGTPGISLCYRVTFTQSSAVTTMTASIQPVDDEADKTISIEEVDNTLTSNVVEGNQWVLNGEDIEGATGSTYEPKVPGDYFVRNTTRQRFDVSNLIKVNAPPAVRQPRQIQVYPNPASDYLDIASDFVESGTHYQVIRSGVVLQEGNLSDENRILLKETLPKGDYLLLLDIAGGKREAVKIILK